MPQHSRRAARPRKGTPGKKGQRRSPARKPATAAPVSRKAVREFDSREVIFIDGRVQGLSATRAAEVAGYSCPRQAGSRLLSDVDIAREIRGRLKERSDRLDVRVDDLVMEHLLVARADPNEVVQVRVTCCRYCYGKDFRYQMTRREIDDKRASYDRAAEKAEQAFAKRKDAKPSDQGPVIPEFDELGGDGFDARKDPNPDCPECFGEGVRRTIVADTRKLSRAGRALYRGVKETEHGVQVMLSDQHAARIEAGRLLGHYVEKVEVADKTGIAERLKRAEARAAKSA